MATKIEATIAPSVLHSRLTVMEIDGSLARDFRRLLTDERMALGIALQSGDGKKIAAAKAEALRLLEIWGH